MKLRTLSVFLLSLHIGGVLAHAAEMVRVSSLAELAVAASGSGTSIQLQPGVYAMADYLTDDVLKAIRAKVPAGPGRPPVPMLEFTGSDNRIDLSGVTIEIDTALYAKLPRGYTRCLIVSGHGNHLSGLTVRNVGVNQGSGGNIFSIHGDRNTIEEFTLQVFGSFPYGYGDLLGKGGPNLLPLQKQSAVLISGHHNTLKRCRVFSRAFGHCFYIQKASNIRLEDCYAEGEVRGTTEMLSETTGPAFKLGFRSVYENRDGRYLITAGYTKSLVEDGFRTYGPLPKITLINCTAVNTRAGFEIGGAEEGNEKTVIENAVATGCERAYLIGSNVIIRRSRGDVKHGPLLYLRGGRNSDIELELVGGRTESTVHALATIAGEGHRVRLTAQPHEAKYPRAPIMLGYGMPAHAEMATPIRPAAARNVTLLSELPGVVVLTSPEAQDCRIESKGPVVTDAEAQKSP